VLHQHLEFGTEGERAVGQQRVEHRLDRQAVARHEKGVAVTVVQGKGEHAAKALHAVLAPGFPGVDDDLGVAAGVEDVAQGFELGYQFLEVVDLAVEDDRHRTVLVEQRLLAGGEVDDRQPPMRERDAGLEVVAPFVRAAMVLHVVHALHEGTIEVALAAGVEEAGDAAHVLAPLFPITRVGMVARRELKALHSPAENLHRVVALRQPKQADCLFTSWRHRSAFLPWLPSTARCLAPGCVEQTHRARTRRRRPRPPSARSHDVAEHTRQLCRVPRPR